jgi:2-iminobutanoate/2-iminopropanoate deaminase
MKKITTSMAPIPAGHYSQAIVHNGLVYLSGQLPIEPQTGEKILDSIEAQTEQVIANIKAILEAAGSGLNQVIKTTVYIADIQLWDRVNQVYTKCFGEHRPARAVVSTGPLHHGFLIEMEAIAAIKNSKDD